MPPILALDLSLTSPGYFSRDEHGIVRSGVWKTPKTLEGSSRMVRLDWIRSQIEDAALKLGPATRVFIEGYAFARANQAHQIGELGGVVRFALWCRGLQIVEVPPPSLKKFVTGKGNADKNLMLLNVYKRWGVEAADDNEADAVGLGRLAMCVLGMDEPTTQEQCDVLAGLGQPRSKPAKKRKAEVA
jgi:crossover junction endodeoxyribonuclease RuvC